MKTLILAAAAALGLSTAAMADDFDRTLLSTTMNVGNLEFSVDGNIDHSDADNIKGGYPTVFGAGIYAFEHQLGEFTGEVFVFGKYYDTEDGVQDFGQLGIEYLLANEVGAFTYTLGTEVSYVMPSNDLGNGDYALRPSINMQYDINTHVGIFTEVDYAWNMSDDFEDIGGTIEVGGIYTFTDNFALVPSIVVPYIEDETGDAMFKLEAVFTF